MKHHFLCPECNSTVEVDLDVLVLTKMEFILTGLSDLQAAVATLTATANSAIALLNSIPSLIAQAQATGDDAALESLAQSITTDATGLQAAVAAGTPAPATVTPVTTPVATGGAAQNTASGATESEAASLNTSGTATGTAETGGPAS